MHTFVREPTAQEVNALVEQFNLSRRDVVNELIEYALANGGVNHLEGIKDKIRRRRTEDQIARLQDKIAELQATL